MEFLKKSYNAMKSYFSAFTKIWQDILFKIAGTLFPFYLDRIEIKDEELINDNYQSGGVGQSGLYKDLIRYITNEVVICKNPHRNDSKFKSLKNSQEFYMVNRRHQCAGCAYEQGYSDAKKGASSNFRIELLNISQAGAVRHKDPKEAYELGYKDGLA